MSRFIVHETGIQGVRVIERLPIKDHRGSLTRLFCQADLAAADWTNPLVQVNLATTKHAGTVRGMHFQCAPHAESKIVTCIRGSIHDVAVDLRKSSETLLKSVQVVLSAEDNKALLIPEGCAHGFQALTDNVEILYFHSAAYDVSAEGVASPFDPLFAIDWPIEVGEMSERDRTAASLPPNFGGLNFEVSLL